MFCSVSVSWSRVHTSINWSLNSKFQNVILVINQSSRSRFINKSFFLYLRCNLWISYKICNVIVLMHSGFSHHNKFSFLHYDSLWRKTEDTNLDSSFWTLIFVDNSELHFWNWQFFRIFHRYRINYKILTIHF